MMWNIAINILVGYISDCIKKLSTKAYSVIKRKLRKEYSVTDFLKALKDGKIRIGDKVTLVGTFSEYTPLTNPTKWLPEYHRYKFGTKNYFDKLENSDIERTGSVFLAKWLQGGKVEINHIPTTTLRLNPINEIYSGSILTPNDKFAYSETQIPLFYSHLYGDTSLTLLNNTSGDQIEIECLVISVSDTFRKATSETAPLLTKDDGSRLPLGLKVLAARSVANGTSFFVNQWIFGHFSSQSLSQRKLWLKIIWEEFLKGNTSIQVGDGDKGRKQILPFFATHDYLHEEQPLSVVMDKIDYDMYLSAYIMRPFLFQFFIGKVDCRCSQLRNEFIAIANAWMSSERLNFLSSDISPIVDFQFDQRDKIWKQTIKDTDNNGITK